MLKVPCVVVMGVRERGGMEGRREKELYVRVCSISSSRMIEIQVQMAQRAIELLALPEDTPSYILDVG